MRTIAEIKKQLSLEADVGLSDRQVRESEKFYGVNSLTPLYKESPWLKFLRKFNEPIIIILLLAALLSMGIELIKIDKVVGLTTVATLLLSLIISRFIKEGKLTSTILLTGAFIFFVIGIMLQHLLVDGMAVMVAVSLATGFAFFSEYRSDKEFELLNSNKESQQAKVKRDGKIVSKTLEEIVVGDIILIEMGDEILADGRIYKAAELYIDQSLMTGEAEPVRKVAGDDSQDGESPEDNSCLYRGTHVVEGIGEMIVCAVGDETYLGMIAAQLRTDKEETIEEIDDAGKRVIRKMKVSMDATPLQTKLAHLADQISFVGYAAAILIFLAQFFQGIYSGSLFFPDSYSDLFENISTLLNYFVTMVVIIVVAVPEGLPMSVTISLALAMRKMTRSNALVRQLVACETIGSATVICSDKTGTLTENNMQVQLISLPDINYDKMNASWTEEGWINYSKEVSSAIKMIILNSALNSTANLEQKEESIITLGNSTEGALLRWLHERDIDYQEMRVDSPIHYQILFTSDLKRMTTVATVNGQRYVLVKGAPEWILDQCQSYIDKKGGLNPLDDQFKMLVVNELERASSYAMRTLAFAYSILPEGIATDEESLKEMRHTLESNLIYCGFVAIRDPVRNDAPAALKACRQAGIEVKMITGDNIATARAIGYDVGLVESLAAACDQPAAPIVTSRYLESLDDQELKKHLPHIKIIARARPLDKYRIVKALQEEGEVVAVTGDGTNDAPALRKADVGLSMGKAGTEVAKEASKIVLLDDSFKTIVKAVQWGRALYENIQRFLQFQLTINVSALVITLLSIMLLNVQPIFTILQFLWINVIMDTLASIALCSEPPRDELMLENPKKRSENILTKSMMVNILLTATYFVVVMLAITWAMKGNPDAPGWLAGDGGWSVRVGNERHLLSKEYLEQSSGAWFVTENAPLEMMRSEPAYVQFTVLQVTLFFSIYVFFQVWNQINCRSLTPRRSGFHLILQNPAFIAIALFVAIGQIFIVTFGGDVFKVEALSIPYWLGVALFTSTVLVFVEVTRYLRRRWT